MSMLGWILLGVVFFTAIWVILFWCFRRDEYLHGEGRFSAKVPPLNLPPFGTLRWTRHGEWEVSAHSPAWAGFCSPRGSYDTAPSDGSFEVIITPHDPGLDRTPSEAQRNAYQFQMDHGSEVANVIFASGE